MDNNEKIRLHADAFNLFYVASRLSQSFLLDCISDFMLFLSLVAIHSFPIFKELKKSGLSEEDINEIVSSMIETYMEDSLNQTFYITISTTDSSYMLSKECYDVVLEAKKISKKSDKSIAIAEITEALKIKLPDVYEFFFNEANKLIKKSDISAPCSVKIPKSLTGCLCVLNSNFSPQEDSCKILGRDKETLELIRILAKDTKRNAVLVGEAGVGKTALVEKFTWMIVTGNCPAKFKDSIVISLDVNSIIAGTNLRGSAEARFKELISFLENTPNCILFVDEIHNLLGAGACRDGDLDLANALKPILARGTTRVIGATTIGEYEKYFSKDKALKRRFEKVVVKEPNFDEVYPMIKNQIERLSKSHGVSISKEVVDDVIFYASCFNKETKNPDRTLDLIDKSMASAELNGLTEVKKEDVLDIFELNYTMLENTPQDVKIALAYHEAGHYLVHHFSNELYNYKTTALSIMPTKEYYGAHVMEIDDDIIPSRTLNYYIQLIASKLAGRVAEQMYSSKLSAGASEDLKNATELAKAVVTQYGLIETFSVNRVFLNAEKDVPYTKDKCVQMDNEIDFLLEKARMYAKYVLKHHSHELELLVDALLSRHMLSRQELDEILSSEKKVILTTCM